MQIPKLHRAIRRHIKLLSWHLAYGRDSLNTNLTLFPYGLMKKNITSVGKGDGEMNALKQCRGNKWEKIFWRATHQSDHLKHANLLTTKFHF